MATYDLEEEEQLAEIKAWWKQYGNLLTNVLLAAVIAVAAWQGWNWYQRSQAGQAAIKAQPDIQVGDIGFRDHHRHAQVQLRAPVI